MTPFPRTIARKAVASTFDDHAIRELVRAGDRNSVYEATVDGRQVACKVTDCRKRTLAREGAVLAAVADGTPVPEPVEAGDGYLVVEWVDGEEYDREADRIEAAASGDVVGEE